MPEPWELEPVRTTGGKDSFVNLCTSSTTEYAHLYAGNLYSEGTRRLFAHVVIHERPLGEIGWTLLASLIVLVTTLTIWLLGGDLLRGSAHSSSDAIAVLLVLPGLLTLARARTGADVRVGPTVAWVGSLAVSLGALAAAVLYLWWAAMLRSGVKAAAAAPRIDVGYAIVVVVISCSIVWCTFRLIVNSRCYRKAKEVDRDVANVLPE